MTCLLVNKRLVDGLTNRNNHTSSKKFAIILELRCHMCETGLLREETSLTAVNRIGWFVSA